MKKTLNIFALVLVITTASITQAHSYFWYDHEDETASTYNAPTYNAQDLDRYYVAPQNYNANAYYYPFYSQNNAQQFAQPNVVQPNAQPSAVQPNTGSNYIAYPANYYYY